MYQFGKVLAFPAHARNFSNAIYTAPNFVTVGPLTAPRSFALDVYAPDESRRGALYRYLRFVGTASVNFAGAAREEILPPITLETSVHDFRLPEGKERFRFKLEEDELPSLHYFITNRWIASTNDPRFRNAVLQSQSQNGRVPRF